MCYGSGRAACATAIPRVLNTCEIGTDVKDRDTLGCADRAWQVIIHVRTPVHEFISSIYGFLGYCLIASTPVCAKSSSRSVSSKGTSSRPRMFWGSGSTVASSPRVSARYVVAHLERIFSPPGIMATYSSTGMIFTLRGGTRFRVFVMSAATSATEYVFAPVKRTVSFL